jgi:asparagine synthase (glutamine-hydrolysing)
MPGLARARQVLQQFTYKAEYAYDYGMPQWLARLDHTFAPLHLERLFLGRHKYYHFRLWYRDSFHQYLKDVLLDPESLRRPYLRGAAVEKIVRAHISGQGNYTLEIHRLLTAELVQRKLLGPTPQRGEAAGAGSHRPCASPVSAAS